LSNFIFYQTITGQFTENEIPQALKGGNKLQRQERVNKRAHLMGTWRVYASSAVESHHPLPEHQQV
jgi:hypothetical protein